MKRIWLEGGEVDIEQKVSLDEESIEINNRDDPRTLCIWQ